MEKGRGWSCAAKKDRANERSEGVPKDDKDDKYNQGCGCEVI